MEPQTYFGLPSTVEYCTKCVISNQRPSSAKEYKDVRETAKNTIAFENGVCSACHYAETKQTKIDWEERDRLRELCDKYRRSDGGYDCIVPGSGGKDFLYRTCAKIQVWDEPPDDLGSKYVHALGLENMEQWANPVSIIIWCTKKRRSEAVLSHCVGEFATLSKRSSLDKNLLLQDSQASRVSIVFYGEHQAGGNDLSETEVPQMNQELLL